MRSPVHRPTGRPGPVVRVCQKCRFLLVLVYLISVIVILANFVSIERVFRGFREGFDPQPNQLMIPAAPNWASGISAMQYITKYWSGKLTRVPSTANVRYFIVVISKYSNLPPIALTWISERRTVAVGFPFRILGGTILRKSTLSSPKSSHRSSCIQTGHRRYRTLPLSIHT